MSIKSLRDLEGRSEEDSTKDTRANSFYDVNHRPWVTNDMFNNAIIVVALD
jgi:hypothetical protein